MRRGNGYKKREQHDRQEHHHRQERCREEINLLTELKDRDRYLQMDLNRLREESYASIRAWQGALLEEKDRRLKEAAEKQGKPLTAEQQESMFDDLLKYATPAIMDLIFIADQIGQVLTDRVQQEADAIIAEKNRTKQIGGLIDLYGIRRATREDKANPPFTSHLIKTDELYFAHYWDLIDQNIQRLIDKNSKAILAEIDKRERARRSREAYGYVRGGRPTTALSLLYKAKREKEINIGEVAFEGVTITLGEPLRGEAGEEQLPGFSDIKDKLTPNLQHSIFYMLKCLHDGGIKAGYIGGPVMQYADIRNITEREAREQLAAAMEILRHAKISGRGRENGEFEDVYIFGGTKKIINGRFFFSFNKDFQEAYFALPAVPYALKLFECNTQYNPYSPALGWKLMQHYNMNKADRNANRISVKSLLKVCELYGLPTYEAVMESDRAVYRRILEPVQRDMNNLEDMGIVAWRYADKGRDEAGEIPFKYEDFIDKFIIFELLDYPDPKEQIEAIVKNREKRKRATEKAELKRLEKQAEKH